MGLGCLADLRGWLPARADGEEGADWRLTVLSVRDHRVVRYAAPEGSAVERDLVAMGLLELGGDVALGSAVLLYEFVEDEADDVEVGVAVVVTDVLDQFHCLGYGFCSEFFSLADEQGFECRLCCLHGDQGAARRGVDEHDVPPSVRGDASRAGWEQECGSEPFQIFGRPCVSVDLKFLVAGDHANDARDAWEERAATGEGIVGCVCPVG